MKSLENVFEYLKTVGVNEDDIKAVYGFLYAEGEMPIEQRIDYIPTEKTFADFIKWYEEEEDEDNEMDGGVFNDEDNGGTIQALWITIHDIAEDCIVGDVDKEKTAKSVVKIDAILHCITDNLIK